MEEGERFISSSLSWIPPFTTTTYLAMCIVFWHVAEEKDERYSLCVHVPLHSVVSLTFLPHL